MHPTVTSDKTSPAREQKSRLNRETARGCASVPSPAPPPEPPRCLPHPTLAPSSQACVCEDSCSLALTCTPSLPSFGFACSSTEQARPEEAAAGSQRGRHGALLQAAVHRREAPWESDGAQTQPAPRRSCARSVAAFLRFFPRALAAACWLVCVVVWPRCVQVRGVLRFVAL